MPVEDRFHNAGLVIKAAIAAIALFPGLAALFGLVPIPEPIERLVQFISFSVGVAVLISIPLLDRRIRRASPERVATVTIIALLLGSALAVTYFRFAETHTVTAPIEAAADQPAEREGAEPRQEVLLVPINPSEAIAEITAPYRGEYEEPLHNSPRAAELRRLMIRERGLTTFVIVLLLVLTQVLMTAPVIAIAWRAAGSKTRRRPRAKAETPAADPGVGMESKDAT
jgi:Ca2+/Na+ antiporter